MPSRGPGLQGRRGSGQAPQVRKGESQRWDSTSSSAVLPSQPPPLRPGLARAHGRGAAAFGQPHTLRSSEVAASPPATKMAEMRTATSPALRSLSLVHLSLRGQWRTEWKKSSESSLPGSDCFSCSFSTYSECGGISRKRTAKGLFSLQVVHPQQRWWQRGLRDGADNMTAVPYQDCGFPPPFAEAVLACPLTTASKVCLTAP